MKWTIDYHPCDGNDPDSEEYWVVTDGNVEFKTTDIDAANWLLNIFNNLPDDSQY